MVKYLKHSFKAMGSTISIEAEVNPEEANTIFQEIENCFKHIEKIATRFDENSDLNILNNNLNHTVEVDKTLIDIIKNAYHAYSITDGKFDPRILSTLNNIGYIDTFTDNKWKKVKVTPIVIRERWAPTFHDDKIYIGSHPIDLGGIGKSYTVWLTSQILYKYSKNFYINAGGDITFVGLAPDASEWTVGVDNPYMEESIEPLAVLAVRDVSVATSSIAKRSWVMADGKRMHHIINPKTGMPANEGIQAITVVSEDVIQAEIWSKSLFFETPENINEITQNLNLPALWFTTDNKMHYNDLMKPYIKWSI